MIPESTDTRIPDPADTRIPDPADRPWYMNQGQLQPNLSSATARTVPIFPEESPGHDRIPDQLMYLPDSVPDNMEEAEAPLKKILLWNGVHSWGGNVKPGRGTFLKQNCPVSSCAILNSPDEVEDADLVLFKDHFSMPGFKRPEKQFWMMYMLGMSDVGAIIDCLGDSSIYCIVHF